jgi:uncharacterized protein (TIGR03067 family)
MRCLSFAILALVLVDHAPGQQPEPMAKPDPDAILGAWAIVGLEAGGKMESEKNFRGNTFTFTKEKAVLQERGYPPIEFSYTLDPTKAPRTIDLATAKGGNTIKGIYKLDGDDLVMALSVGGSARPAEFTTKAGGDTETFTLRHIGWQRHSDKASGFSVELPGKPEERSHKIDTPAGPATTTFLVVHHDPDRVTYLVAVTPLPGKLEAKDAEAALEAVQKAVVAEVDQGARSRVEGEPKGFKTPAVVSFGKELVLGLELPDAKDKVVPMRLRLFIAGDRLYALAVAGTEEGTRSPSVGRFWNSFRTGDEKKEPARKQ